MKVKDHPASAMLADPVEYFNCDLKRQVDGLEIINKCFDTVRDAPTTYEIFKAYLKDDEDDLYWSKTPLS